MQFEILSFKTKPFYGKQAQRFIRIQKVRLGRYYPGITGRCKTIFRLYILQYTSRNEKLNTVIPDYLGKFTTKVLGFKQLHKYMYMY